MPIVAIIKPSTAPISPLITFLEEMLVTMLRPNIARAKYSAAPNFRANLLSSGAVHSSITALNRPPNVDAMVEILMARPGWCSFVAMGYPSNTVAAEFAVPGVLIRIAVMDPP